MKSKISFFSRGPTENSGNFGALPLLDALPAGGTCAARASRRLPDGIGTNGAVREVPQFRMINFNGNMWQHGGNMWLHVWASVATCARLKQHTATCRGFVALVFKKQTTCLSSPRVEASEFGRGAARVGVAQARSACLRPALVDLLKQNDKQ